MSNITRRRVINNPSPNGSFFYSVETPSVFREIELPENEANWTKAEREVYDELEALAERHGTYVKSHSFQRG